MGYTHYWNLQDELNDDVLGKVSKVLNKYKNIIQMEFNNPNEPVISSDHIVFNGIGEDGHETFYLEPYGDDFCKTNEKPYDLVVCEVLLILKHSYREKFELSSDGLWVSREDLAKKRLGGYWSQALRNVKKDFGFEFNLLPIIDNGYYSVDIKAV